MIDYEIFRQGENDPVPGGYIVFILMEKVPENLENFDTFPLEKRDRVRIAFGKAIRYGLLPLCLFDFVGMSMAHRNECKKHTTNFLLNQLLVNSTALALGIVILVGGT